MSVEWVKLSTSMFDTSRKIKQIEQMQGGDTIIVIWIKLLCLAGAINDNGAIYITPKMPYTDDSLATELKRPPKIVKKALEIFEGYGMIERVDGVIYLSSWGKYQNIDGLDRIREQTRQRVAKCRKNKNAFDCNATVTQSNATCNATVTQSNTLEEEGEEETDKEKEIHPFIHSNAREREEAQRKYFFGIGKGVVLLSDEQLGDLLDKLSLDEFDKYVGIVADCELNGQHFKKKTHYQAILDMAMKDRKTK